MTTYKLMTGVNGKLVEDAILLVETNSTIPFDPTNTDYQAYLKWLEEGNEPEPADEQQGA